MNALGRKKPPIRRRWDKARAKVEQEGVCRACGSPYGLEAAHVVGRVHDAKPPLRGDWKSTNSRSAPYEVAPDRVIPLCHECHQGPNGQHANRLDLLPLLSLHEQIQAVADAGGISRAYQLLMPSESPRRLRDAA